VGGGAGFILFCTRAELVFMAVLFFGVAPLPLPGPVTKPGFFFLPVVIFYFRVSKGRNMRAPPGSCFGGRRFF
jgi:hypothetical protein